MPILRKRGLHLVEQLLQMVSDETQDEKRLWNTWIVVFEMIDGSTHLHIVEQVCSINSLTGVTYHAQ
jgi:hypothetical protein